MTNSRLLRTALISTLRRAPAIVAMAVVQAMFAADVVPAAESPCIFMRTGSQMTLKAPFPVAHMSEDNASVVAASLPNTADKTDVLLVAKAAGATTVTLLGESADAQATYNVAVLNLLPSDVMDLVKTIPGLEVKGIPSGVIVQGVVFTKKDKDQIDAICAQRSHDIINLVGYNPVDPLLLKRIKELINVATVKVGSSGDSVMLTGSVVNDEGRKRAEDLTKSIADKVLDEIVVQPQEIDLDCAFISADRDWRKQLGANLLGNGIGLAGAVTSSGPIQSSFLSNTSYNVAAAGGAIVDCLEQNARNKVLCKPHLAVISGKPAEVLSGGQIGIRLPGAVQYLPYGLTMKILPTLDADNNVQSDLVFQLSSIPTHSNAGLGDISNTTFSISTTVRCKLNETIICTGLTDTRSETVEQRTPILGYIPIICYLGFRHNVTVDRENEVLVCITPHLSKTVTIPPIAKQSPEDSKKLLQQEQPEK